MKHVFMAAFAGMTLLSGVAALWRPEVTDDRIELVWCSDANPMRFEQVAAFNESQDTYRVTLDPDNHDKIIVQSLGGVGPDFFACYSGYQHSMFVRSGIALDVTEAFEERGIDLEETAWPFLRPYYQSEGRVYGHPDNSGTPVLFYNRDLFDEAGEPYPASDWTWEKLEEVAVRMTQRDARGRPKQFGLMLAPAEWMNLLPNWGGHIFNEAGTRCILDIPETILTVEKTVWDPLHRYDYSPTPGEEMAMASAGGWGSGIIDLFGAGKSAMAIGGRWWLCLLRRPDYDDLRMGVVEIPKGTVGKVGAYGKATLINAETEHLDGALAFMEFMHSRKFNELINEQADGLAAIKEYCYTDDYLFNPEYPDETYNEVFRNACENAVAQEICPYVNGQRVDINLVKQIDLVRTGQKRPAEAMRDAAEAINEEIIKHLSIDEDLRGKYKRAISEGAEPAWDEPEDAPW